MGSLTEEVIHPAAALIQSYIEEEITAHDGTPWSPKALETAIFKGTYASACTLDMNTFIWG